MVMLTLFLAASAPVTLEEAHHRSPITAQDLVEIAEISAPSLSPDGQRIAYRVSRPSVAANSTQLEWYVSDVDGSETVHIGSGGTAQYEGSGGLEERIPVWDADSKGLHFLALVDGAVGIWHWREGRAVQREILSDADIVDFAISRDGSTLRYTIGATRTDVAAAQKRAYEGGVLVDQRLDIMQPVAGGLIEDGHRIMQRLPTQWFARAKLLWDAPRKTYFAPIAGHISPPDPQFATASSSSPSTIDPAILSKSSYGKSVIATNGDRADLTNDDDISAVIVTRANKDKIICSAAPCGSSRLVALDWQPGQDSLLLFERTGGGRETIWSWTVGSSHARRLPTTDGSIRTSYRPPRCVAAKTALVCTESRPVEPPRLVRIDYSTGQTTVLADPNSGVRSRTAALVSSFHAGDDVSGILLRPRNAKQPLPLVVHYYHCDGFLKGGTGDEIPMLPLVEHGIAILCLDQSRAPKTAGMDGSYKLALSQIDKSVDQLVRDTVVDPRRVGIGGLSFGSEVALWAVRHSKRFAAATLSSGQLSSIYYWANALPGRGFAEMLRDYWKLGDPDQDTAQWKELAPEDDIEAITTPLLMQLPESEGRFVIKFHTKLKQAGKPADLFLFADEPHVKYQPQHKLAVYQRNLDWYRFWLKDEEDPDPEKADQYARWESYRAEQSLPVPAP